MKTGKLTGQVLQAAMKKFLAARQKGKTKLHHGQQSLRQLKKDGSALSNIEITDANIGLFRPCAKKYDIDYTLRKDSSTHPHAAERQFHPPAALYRDFQDQAGRQSGTGVQGVHRQEAEPGGTALYPQGPVCPETKGCGQDPATGQGESQGKGAVTVKPEVKKLILSNLPYLIFVYLFGKLGQAYRLAAGVDLSEKLLHFMDGCSAAPPF